MFEIEPGGLAKQVQWGGAPEGGSLEGGEAESGPTGGGMKKVVENHSPTPIIHMYPLQYAIYLNPCLNISNHYITNMYSAAAYRL